MGMINPTTSRTVHKIVLQNSQGESVGRIEITAFYHNREDGVLNPLGPSGHHNRKIVSTLEYYNVRMGNPTLKRLAPEPDPQPTLTEEEKRLSQLVVSLEENKGLKSKDGQIVRFDAQPFAESFKKFVSEQDQWKAEFK